MGVGACLESLTGNLCYSCSGHVRLSSDLTVWAGRQPRTDVSSGDLAQYA